MKTKALFKAIYLIGMAALAYLWWIAPHLNSETAVRDIFKTLFSHGIPLLITLSLLMLPAVGWRRYCLQHADALAALQWTKNVPPAVVRAVLLLVFAVFGAAVFGIVLMRLFGKLAAWWFG